MNFSLKDIQSRQMDLKSITPAEEDRLSWRIVSLKENEGELNEVERDFIRKMMNYLVNNNLSRVTQAQAKWIYRMWHELYQKGRVELPKGKF